eukprot:scaffold302574_cov119-Cyclotella_meneghiniana.AAC.1
MKLSFWAAAAMPWRLAAESEAANTFTGDDNALDTKVVTAKAPTHKPTHGNNNNLSDLFMQKVTKQPSSSRQPFIPLIDDLIPDDSQPLKQSDRQDELFFMTVTRSPTKKPSKSRADPSFSIPLSFDRFCSSNCDVSLCTCLTVEKSYAACLPELYNSCRSKTIQQCVPDFIMMEFEKVYCPYSTCIMEGISGETTCDREGYISLCDLYQDREECKDIGTLTDGSEASLTQSGMEFDGLDDINDFSMSLPGITAKDDDFSMSLPEITVENDDASMSLPEITVENDDASMSLPEITAEDDDASMSVPDTTIEDEDFSMSLQDTTNEDDELIMSLPEATITDSPTASLGSKPISKPTNHPTLSLINSETISIQNLSAKPSSSVTQSPTTKTPSVRPSNKPTVMPISAPTMVG